MSDEIYESDSRDFFNRRLKYVVVPLVFFWLARTFFFGVAHVESGSDGGLVSVARDSGLRMSVHSSFPNFLLHLHSYCGAFLIVSCITQKILVSYMHTSPAWRILHRTNGIFCVLSMVLMSVAGYAMNPYSKWPNFAIFSVFFAAPWLTWCTIFLAPYALPSLKKKKSWRHVHAFVGNMTLKGSLTVPAARWCGALLQHVNPLWSEHSSYYVGIGAVTVAVLLWQMVDSYHFILRPCLLTLTQKKQKKK